MASIDTHCIQGRRNLAATPCGVSQLLEVRVLSGAMAAGSRLVGAELQATEART